MSIRGCINCKVYQLKLAFIGKGTGLTEVFFVFLQRTLTFLDNQLALVLQDNQQIVVNPNLHVCIQ